MIISTVGFGNSGSSAVLDYLRGYNQFNVVSELEFQFLHQADGINDLKYALVYNRERIAINSAVHRFIKLQEKGAFANRMRKLIGDQYDMITKEYIESLAPLKWRGLCSNYDPVDVGNRHKGNKKINKGINLLLNKINNNWCFPPAKDRYFSILPEAEFDRITKEYIRKLFSLLGLYEDNKTIVMDQLFSVTSPLKGTEFFDSSKIIIINREPRDLYIQSQLHPTSSRFMPIDTVENFVLYYKMMQDAFVSDASILYIQYEDLIYRYDEATEKIRNYLGISDAPENEFKFFDPKISIKYTNQKPLHPEFEKDIKYIEENLQDYLYDFDCTVV